MNVIVETTNTLKGSACVPPSKSHTHRAIILASLASGPSIITKPLLSRDCQATIDACKAIGASITQKDSQLLIDGVHGTPQLPEEPIDVGNSGTTLRLMSAVVAHCNGAVLLTGDQSIQQRPIEPLLHSLNDLGATAVSIKGNGRPPVSITGIITGGDTTIQGISSQFISGLLIACPLAQKDSTIHVTNLKSAPYLSMTLSHLNECGVQIEQTDYAHFFIPKNQIIKPRHYQVPADFSSASFLIAASFITDSTIEIEGLNPDDVQGDKMIYSIIQTMRKEKKRFIDLSDAPDLLPISAVMACYAKGTTRFINVEHARFKESDRIKAIATELKKMGADIQEHEDGLTVHHSTLTGAHLKGYNDHRIVMALTIAGLGAQGTTEIENAETIAISYPQFIDTMRKLNAKISLEES